MQKVTRNYMQILIWQMMKLPADESSNQITMLATIRSDETARKPGVG